MIKIAIADDESTVLSELTQKLKSYFAKGTVSYSIHTFRNGTDLLQSPLFFDLIFLDIQMDGLSGMDTAKLLRKNGVRGFIVFITVLQEYVYDAFEVDASDYLLKPIDDVRFIRTMDRLSDNIQNTDTASLVISSRGNTYQSLLFRDIYYLEASNHKITFYTASGVYEGYFKITEMAGRLDNRFFQCHRSYFVNLDFVCGYEDGLAFLTNGSKVPVSRLRINDFSQAVLSYMKV